MGIWLGLPGRYEPDFDEINEVMDRGGGRRRRVKKYFTPFAWMQRNIKTGTGAGRGRGGRFKLESPDDKD